MGGYRGNHDVGGRSLGEVTKRGCELIVTSQLTEAPPSALSNYPVTIVHTHIQA